MGKILGIISLLTLFASNAFGVTEYCALLVGIT